MTKEKVFGTRFFPYSPSAETKAVHEMILSSPKPEFIACPHGLLVYTHETQDLELNYVHSVSHTTVLAAQGYYEKESKFNSIIQKVKSLIPDPYAAGKKLRYEDDLIKARRKIKGGKKL